MISVLNDLHIKNHVIKILLGQPTACEMSADERPKIVGTLLAKIFDEKFRLRGWVSQLCFDILLPAVKKWVGVPAVAILTMRPALW